MDIKNKQQQRLIEAKKKVRQLKLFYIHLLGYLVLATLILYNFYILEDGEFKKTIIWVNSTSLIAWTIFIGLHGYNVFKGHLFFKKGWEERKMKEYLDRDTEENKTMWE